MSRRSAFSESSQSHVASDDVPDVSSARQRLRDLLGVLTSYIYLDLVDPPSMPPPVRTYGAFPFGCRSEGLTRDAAGFWSLVRDQGFVTVPLRRVGTW